MSVVATNFQVETILDTRRRRRVPGRVWFGGGIILVVALLGILAPLIAPYQPNAGAIAVRLRPIFSAGHLLGTDGEGRDILSRLLWGARLSLTAGFVPVVVAGVVGTGLGTVAGLSKRRMETTIMRVLDVFYAFPAVLLAIAINASLGPGISNAVLALSIVLVPPIARVTNTEVARMRNTDFMESARASGASWPTITLRQVLPNIAPAVLVYCTALIGLAVVFAAGLSFLGLGVAPPTAEWGSMLNDLSQDLYTAPVLTLIPAIAIFITSLAFNVLGDGLRDLLDVRREVVQ